MGAETSRIKRGRKYEQVVEGARDVFLHDGFEGASVDDIARAAGVSKATLYSYFPDKRLLFIEVATGECRRQSRDTLAEIDQSAPPEVVLRQAAERLMCVFLSDFGRSVFRVVVAETERFPELGRVFWQNGPGRAKASLVAYFETAVARGELKIDDLELAAAQFMELCKADLFARMIAGLDRSFTAEERERVIAGAIEMFLARYGT